ncbi:unnamed protein product [Adineta ricciae]|uniref:Tetratricopeptide repeat protein n=1 Tax=Adineta ricciae TaxID=249248 RepID=A0A814PYK7_ADIRI|nr:unnamed protein product [Adineta ricciae]CAF1652223.1 unnamed protein product [Adineta ricciae]
MGCSESKVESKTIEPIETKPSPLAITQHLVNDPQPVRVVENFVLLWYSPNSLKGWENIKTGLRKLISYIKIFYDSNECITYIESIRIERVILLVPNMDSWVTPLEKLSQVERIYVFNDQSNIESFCQQLKTDLDLCELDLINITVFPNPTQIGVTSAELKRQEASFLLGQLMREMLHRLKFENNAKTEFVNFFRMNYAHDEEQLRAINDFETNYRPNKALAWLMRPCFLQRVIQRLERTYEFDLHYKIAFFAKHVCIQMNIFQENISLAREKNWIVYRGKTMPPEIFENLLKNKSGCLFSISAYFIAETNKDFAVDFICRRLMTYPERIGVIFEMHIDPAARSARSPCAWLEEVYGSETNEKEGILFSGHSAFRIEAIEEVTEQSKAMWLIKLVLVSDDDPQLLRIVLSLRSSDVYTNPLSYLGKLLMEKGDYEQAEEFFLALLLDPSVLNQPHRLARVHRGLATNYAYKGEYSKALGHYQQAIEHSSAYLPPDHPDFVPLYDGIGNCYYKMGSYQNAIEKYEEAAKMLSKASQSMNEQLTSDLNTRIANTKKLLSHKP